MSPKRPYILRALYEWLIDNELTPHIVVDAEWPYIQVPQQFVQDGQIVLNIAPGALQGLQMGNEEIRFHARFQGKEQRVLIPMGALLAIYAKENGAGTIFEPEEGYLAEIQSEHQTGPSIALATTDTDAADVEGDAEGNDGKAKGTSEPASSAKDSGNNSENESDKKKAGPSLRIVK